MTGPLLRRLLCLVLLAAPAAALAPDRAVSQYQVDAWAERQGLPQASVGAIAQDHDGYLWLATQEGVARFDGVELQSYTVEDVPEIRHNFVRALHTDAAGRVWLGTHAGSLSFVAGGHFTVVEPGRRSLGPAVGISSDAGGRVFAAFGRAGLFHATGRGLEPVPAATRGTSAPVGRLIRGRSGLLWLGVTGGVVRGDATAWTFLPVAWTGGRRVSALAEDHEGNLWIACGGPEAIRLDVRSTTARPLGPPLRLPAPIRNLLYDSRGTLWIAGDDGLYRVREGASSLPERLPRPAGAVDTVAEDRDGGLWIGTHTEGLLRLRTAELTPFGVPEGLPHDMVWNVLETQDGSLWASTDGGLVRLRRGRAEEVRSARFPTSDVVALAEGRDATLWAGTFRHGVFRLRPGAAEWEGLGAAHGIPPGPVTAIFEDRRGRLWVGSREGLAVGDGHRFQPVPQTGSLYVTSLVEDAAGTVWVATYGAGLFGFAGAGVRRYGVAQGLPSEQLNALLLDSAGRLWIATNDRGLAVLDHGRIGRVGTAHGLPYALILWLVDDRRGALWMSTNHGLVRVSFADLARTAFGAQTRITTARFFDESDGLRGTGFSATGQPAGWRARDGRLWFPSGTGLAVVDPARLAPPVPPRAVIRSIVVDGTRQALPAPGRALDLAPGRGELTAQLTALGFDEAAGTRFRHRLVGFDGGWRDAGTTRAAGYTNLPPGAYRLEVAAQHPDGGAWGPVASLDLHLAPLFTQTRAFQMLLAAGVIALATAGNHLRNRRLQSLVARRTRELGNANAELAAAAQREQEARAKAEAALRDAERAGLAKTHFLATVSHDLRTPLYAILDASDRLSETTLDQDQSEYNALMQEGGKTLLRLVDDVLDFARIEQGQVTLRPEPFDLTGCLESALAPSVSLARAKGIRLHWTFPPAGKAPILGDGQRVRQVAGQLIANAVKFTAKGEVEATAALRGEGDACTLHLSVRDTGVGIAPEHQEKIFQPFVQAEGGLSRPYGGTGLGLALTRRLCETMGGAITVESSPGAGSTFRVRLPVQRAG